MRLSSFLSRHRHFFLIVFVIAGAISFFIYVSPTEIVQWVGVKNIYIATFLFAIIGGVSALTATSFYATLFAFALGGANPFFLALISAPGVLIGDFLFWYLGHKGKAIVRPVIGRRIEGVSRWLSGKPRWAVPLGAYLYTGFIPLPGEFLMVTLALIGVPFSRVLIPTLLGNFTLALIVTLGAVYGYSFTDFFI